MARLPRDIQTIIDRLEPEIRRAFLEAIDQITGAAQMNRLIAALEAGNVEEAIEALRIEQGFFGPLNEATRGAYLDGGNFVLAGLKLKDPFSGDKFMLGFDGRHVRAERWLRDQSSGLIVEIIDQQREMAREVLRKKLETGTNPRTTALDIVGRMSNATGKREGGFIGLTTQQARWALNAEAQLRNLDSSYFTRQRRDKRFDGLVRKAIKDGKPIAEADIQRIVTRYRDRLKKYRGDTIARTEALNSLRAGQFEGFQQLVDSGKVDPDRIERTWSDTGDSRTRHDHRLMRGQKVKGVTQPFTFPDGTQALYPGDPSLGSPPQNLIQCRCLVTVRIKSDLMR